MAFTRDLSLTVLCCAAVLLILEGGLRLAGDRYNASFAQPEAERGFSLRPNAEGWNAEGNEVYIKINSDGMRDRERQIERPGNTLRIAVLGASDAENPEVPLEDTFEAVMERTMRPEFERHGKSLDVLNFGVTFYSMAQQYLTLQHHVWKYDPQIVVLIFDQFLVLRNTMATYPDGEGWSGLPFYTVRDGRLVLDEPTPALLAIRRTSPLTIAVRNRLADLVNRVYLIGMLNWARVQFKGRLEERRHLLHLDATSSKGSKEAATRPGDYIQWWPYVPDKPEMREDWDVTDHLLLAMKEDCARRGAEFWVVITDGGIQTIPDRSAREAFMRSKGLTSLDDSDRRLEKFCEKNAIHVFSVAPPLRKLADEKGWIFHGKTKDNAGHWNRLGNEVVGKLLAGELEEHGTMVNSWLGRP